MGEVFSALSPTICFFKKRKKVLHGCANSVMIIDTENEITKPHANPSRFCFIYFDNVFVKKNVWTHLSPGEITGQVGLYLAWMTTSLGERKLKEGCLETVTHSSPVISSFGMSECFDTCLYHYNLIICVCLSHNIWICCGLSNCCTVMWLKFDS